jgi:hypothetical protein
MPRKPKRPRSPEDLTLIPDIEDDDASQYIPCTTFKASARRRITATVERVPHVPTSLPTSGASTPRGASSFEPAASASVDSALPGYVTEIIGGVELLTDRPMHAGDEAQQAESFMISTYVLSLILLGI